MYTNSSRARIPSDGNIRYYEYENDNLFALAAVHFGVTVEEMFYEVGDLKNARTGNKFNLFQKFVNNKIDGECVFCRSAGTSAAAYSRTHRL